MDYKLAGNLNESIASLSRLPELAWMGRLKGRADIDWRAIEAVHDHWQRHEAGIGGPGVSLAAHGGDIGAVFEDLLSSDTLLAVATAGLMGGLTQNLYERFNLPLEAGANLGSLSAEQLVKKALLDTAVQTGLDTALYGADPLAALLGNLQVAAGLAGGGRLSAEIGKAYYDNPKRALQLIAQSAVGCGLAAGAGGACASGAAGAVLGETGKITPRDILDSPYAELADFIADVNTLVDPESSRVEKGMAVLNIVTGINSQTGEGSRNLAAGIIDKAGKIGKGGNVKQVIKNRGPAGLSVGQAKVALSTARAAYKGT